LGQPDGLCMKHTHRCQLAELVTVGLHDAGVRPHTRPWVFTAQIFQPIFERNVPIQRRTRAERRQVPIIWVALLPLMLVGLVLVAPIEIWRWLRARQRNTQMMAQLPQPSETSVTYRNAPAHEAGESLSTLIASASEVVCFDFRIEEQGRAVLLGAAVGLLHEGERDKEHISIGANRVILVIIFDDRSSLGLVRLRVKKGAQELARVFECIIEKSNAQPSAGLEAAFAEITDDDIDNLFG